MDQWLKTETFKKIKQWTPAPSNVFLVVQPTVHKLSVMCWNQTLETVWREKNIFVIIYQWPLLKTVIKHLPSSVYFI
jgi:hypothetical protein